MSSSECKGSTFKDEKLKLIGVLLKANVHDLKMVEGEEGEEDMIIPTKEVHTMLEELQVQVVVEVMIVIEAMTEVIEVDMEGDHHQEAMIAGIAAVIQVTAVLQIVTEVMVEIEAVDMIVMTEVHEVGILREVDIPREVGILKEVGVGTLREVDMSVHMTAEVMTDPLLLLLQLVVTHLRKDHTQVMKILREEEVDTMIEDISDLLVDQAPREVRRVCVSNGRRVIVVLAAIVVILMTPPLEVHQLLIMHVVDMTVMMLLIKL
jgi:hypothetical protein